MINDFTRDELESLRDSLDLCKYDDGTDDKLMMKLEYLIDNYPIHLDVSELETQTR